MRMLGSVCEMCCTYQATSASDTLKVLGNNFRHELADLA